MRCSKRCQARVQFASLKALVPLLYGRLRATWIGPTAGSERPELSRHLEFSRGFRGQPASRVQPAPRVQPASRVQPQCSVRGAARSSLSQRRHDACCRRDQAGAADRLKAPITRPRNPSRGAVRTRRVAAMVDPAASSGASMVFHVERARSLARAAARVGCRGARGSGPSGPRGVAPTSPRCEGVCVRSTSHQDAASESMEWSRANPGSVNGGCPEGEIARVPPMRASRVYELGGYSADLGGAMPARERPTGSSPLEAGSVLRRRRAIRIIAPAEFVGASGSQFAA